MFDAGEDGCVVVTVSVQPAWQSGWLGASQHEGREARRERFRQHVLVPLVARPGVSLTVALQADDR